jgi:anti-sigma factor ChrR (cupin superfamily)
VEDTKTYYLESDGAHPSPEELHDYAHNLLNVPDRVAIARHVNACEYCRDRVIAFRAERDQT